MADPNQFRSRKALQRIATDNTEQTRVEMEALKLIFKELLGKVAGYAARLDDASKDAALLDWRLTALMDLVMEKLGVSEEDLNARIQKHQLQAFTANSEQHDRQNNLVPTEEAPQEGMYAIFTMDLFRNGEELKEEHLFRSKALLGAGEVNTDIEFVLLNMKVGETVSVTTELNGTELTAGLTLLELRKPAPKEEKSAAPAPEAASNAATPEAQ